MPSGVQFNGYQINSPGAYATIDANAIGYMNNSSQKVLALIGECTGGTVGEVMFFDNVVSARKVLRSGDLFNACMKAWNPVARSKEGVNTYGASMIACIRSNVNGAAQATNTSNGVTVTSVDYGAHTNQYSLTQTTNSDGNAYLINKGYCDISVRDGSTGAEEKYANIGQVFVLCYKKGSNDTAAAFDKAQYKVDSNGISIKRVAKSGQTLTGDTEITQAAVDSISTLRQNLSVGLGGGQVYTESPMSANVNLRGSDIDKVPTYTDMTLVDGVYKCVITAVSADFVDRVNRNQSSMITAEITAPASTSTTIYASTTTLSGGADGTSPVNDWSELIEQLSAHDVDYVVPLTSNAAVHAAVADHCREMSGTAGKERRAVVGGGQGESISDTVSRASNLNSSRVQIVHGGFWDYITSDNLTYFPPYILAAAVAGRACGIGDGESITHDIFRMAEPEYQSLTKSEISSLTNGGCIAFEQVITRVGSVNAETRLVWDVTTYTSEANRYYTERAIGDLADTINKELRAKLDSLLVGRKGTIPVLTTAKNAVASVLYNRKTIGDILDYKNINIVKDADALYIEYNVALAEPINFVLITTHYYSEPISV